MRLSSTGVCSASPLRKGATKGRIGMVMPDAFAPSIIGAPETPPSTAAMPSTQAANKQAVVTL